MLIEYKHKIYFFDTNSKFIMKSLDNRSILEKEFFVLQYLHKNILTRRSVPIVSHLRLNYYYEEKISARRIEKSDLTDSNINKLASILSKIHTLKFTKKIQELVKNDYLSNGRYQPLFIMKTLLKNAPKHIVRTYKKRLINLSYKISTNLSNKQYNIGLIHGDLNPNNILLSNKKIVLIDWTDCRLDIPSCDVVQLFYFLEFNERQKKIFLKKYKSNYITEELIRYQTILLLLYDIVSSYQNEKFFDKKKIKKIDKLLG